MAKLARVPILMISLILLRSTFALGGLQCEDLTIEDCAFAVSSTGARCVLEKSTLPDGKLKPECQTSLTMAEKPEEWIESDECIRGCGVERESYGMSTDLLLESGFAEKLCSSECKNNCPNIIDLYLKLAAGEGLYLPHLCTDIQSRSRRLIADPIQAADSDSSSYGPVTAPPKTTKSKKTTVLISPGPSSQVVATPAPDYSTALLETDFDNDEDY